MSLEHEIKVVMEDTIFHLREELKGLRTGRANPAIVDGVMVEIYSTTMRLRDIANVTVPESRQLLITPFDPNNVSIIAKAIEGSGLSLQPLIEGNVVRIIIPPMDETVRRDIVRLCNKKREEAKIAIRNIRRDSNDKVRKKKQMGEVTEDTMKQQEKMIQDMTDKYCSEIDEICSHKEKEILEI